MRWMLAALLALATGSASAAPNKVEVYEDERGFKLQVDGEDFFVFGMNWDYFPVGTNYTYNFWAQSDEFIKKALDYDLKVLGGMGVNVLRLYVGVPPKWIRYIYEEHKMYTVLNHAMGRYGYLVDGTYEDPINYQNSRHREVIANDIYKIVEAYKDTPGLLFYLLGNENNYGLFWESAETEDVPEEKKGELRAQYLYSLYGEITEGIQARDKNHPVAIANGDIQYIDLIAKYCPTLDIMGANVYRGAISGNLFDEVKEKLGIPFVYTEFGSDAYDAKRKQEADIEQAAYLRTQWQEIYEHAYGKGRSGTAIGGMIFQWVDGWWKTGQTVDLDKQNTKASWSNQAYIFDWQPDANNMNEEWFGIAAKSRSDENGLYEVYPRTAYYLLQEGFKLNPYNVNSLEQVRDHWGRLSPQDFSKQYQIDSLSNAVKELQMVKMLNVRMDFKTFTTGGSGLANEDLNRGQFDHLESFYFDFGLQPTNNFSARASINGLGNIPTNPINPIFYENRALAAEEDLERFQLYQAEFEWDEKWFKLEGYYRTQHYHWGYEGDFFGLYQEANYPSVPMAFVEGVDTFNADAPLGAVWTGKKWFDGFKIAFGPQLYWGANPGMIAKYYKEWGKLDLGIIHQEDFEQFTDDAGTSSAIPLPRTRKSTVSLGYKFGKFQLKAGGIIAGSDRLNRDYTIAREATGPGNGYLDSGYDILDDEIEFIDTLGGKAKLVYTGKPFNFYLQGSFKGLVADGFGDPTDTITGWILDEVGQGNHWAVGGGLAYMIGDFQIAPNFIYQEPLQGPLPSIPQLALADGRVFTGVAPRNQVADPFWVRGNRQMLAGELLIAFDPTPATWMWAWDAIRQEDAFLSGYIDFVYRHLPTSQDSGVGILNLQQASEGLATFAPPPEPGSNALVVFGGAPPARDLWEVTGRVIMVPNPQTKITLSGYGGTIQSTGIDPRLIERVGFDYRLLYRRLDWGAFLKFNDWGPYDFQRDLNLTFPVQVATYLTYGLKAPEWFMDVYTNFGAQFTYRSLDQYSDGIATDLAPADRTGEQWEVMSYVQIAL
ncbi:MAG: hypothetical protein AAF851_09850 [Myxococcota bacterium]